MTTPVLIISPTPEAREQLVRAAREAGVPANVSESFDRGLASIETAAPALVVAEMPDSEDGLDKLKATLRARAPVTPFLAYLSERNTDMALKCMAAGAYDCLCPPLTAGDFLAAGKRAVWRMGRTLLTNRPYAETPWWRHPVFYTALGLAVFLGLLGLGLFGLWAPPFQMYKLATEHPVGIAGDQDMLWVADWSQQNLAAVHPQGDYVAIHNVVRMPDFQPVAVAVAPFYLYTAGADGRLRRHRKDDTFTVVASVEGPGHAMSGLAWDGESLWSCDADTGKIYQHDSMMDVKRSFTSPARKPVGLAWEGGALWVADAEARVLWRLTPDGAEWKKEGPFLLEIFNHNKNLALSGFTLWKGRLWIVSESGGVLIQHRVPEVK
jgi:hypothetical protein